MTSQPGSQTIAIHLLSNISECTDKKIWSINRTKQEKYFSPKIKRKMRQGD